MSQINVNDLTFGYTTNYDMIFEHVSFQIDTDWRLGFIGRNGRGKTTFLKLLLGTYDYQGTITSPVSFSYFPFEVEDEAKLTMTVIKDTIAPYSKWELEMEQCLKENHSEESLERYRRFQELYLAHDGYIIEELIEKELGKLRVNSDVLSRPYHTLSFGERILPFVLVVAASSPALAAPFEPVDLSVDLSSLPPNALPIYRPTVLRCL
jgi:lincosamide and streptogramin A transport system ATP-binding/permease protein